LKKAILLIALLSIILLGCSNKNSYPEKNQIFPIPTDIVSTATESGLIYHNDNLNVGIFHFDLSGRDELSIFDCTFSNITYVGLTNQVMFDVQISDDDFTHSVYQYELYNVTLDELAKTGKFPLTKNNSSIRIGTDAIDSGDLWSIIITKTTSSTQETTPEVGGFFFQVNQYDQRHKLTENNVSQDDNITPEMKRTNIKIRFELQSEETIDQAYLKVFNSSTGNVVFEETYDNFTVNEAYVISELVSGLSPDTTYTFMLYVSGSDGVIHYDDVLVKQTSRSTTP
jgi:uncharacterized FlaG/YvyC family protein